MAGDEASSQTVRVGALSALLKDLVRADVPEPVSAWDAALKPGAIIGRFELVREIGRGGFGVVWEARDPSLGRAVALKAVRPGARADLREERLLREAEAAARLSHPNIVTLYDVGRTEHGPYLVLELLRGEALARRLERGSVPLREALRVAVEAAKGLAHAHTEGVIHRDLTPGNVFLCADGQVKVLDFGMAHAFGHRKVDGGTRAYMAPEQARGAPEDERTDVFALGVILHQMLSGEPPFPDAEALLRSSPAPGLEIPEAPALAVLVGRMLEKDPVKRPRDAGEVLQALTAIQRELEQVPSSGRSQVRTRPSSSGMKDFLAELKRRRVIRALLGWGIFSFAVLQIYEPVMHGLHLPEWTLSAVVVVLASGFPATMVLAWIFDIRSGGIERTVPEGGGGLPGRSRLRAKRLALLLVGTGVVAAVPLVAWYFWSRPGRETAAAVGAAPAAATVPSIAVLPFVDMSAGHDQEYFSDGIAEEILNALAHVQGLHVTGRTSSFSFKGKNEDLTGIAQKLHAASILEGSVRKEGNRVRITAQLINASDGYHLWSETYDRQLTDVFVIQDEIAGAVVAALVPRLVGRPESAPPASPATSPDAYNQYLIGQQFLGRYTEESYRRAAQAFEKALALDPSYAPAWAGLAEALFLVINVTDEEPRPLLERARTAADRAVALAPQLAAGYQARSLIRRQLWDWDGAMADADRAVSLQPGDATGIRRRALVVQEVTGNDRLVIDQFRYATQLDPLSPHSWAALGDAYHNTGQADLARQAFLRALEIDPDHQGAIRGMVWNEAAAGNLEAARRMLARVEAPPYHMWFKAILAHKLGAKAAAQEATEQYAARYGSVDAHGVALLHAIRGEHDLAFEWLDRSFLRREPDLRGVKLDECFQPFHGDPRWKGLLKKMNLPVD